MQAINDDTKKTTNKYSVGIGPVRFQLQHMGHYLMREERKDPDPRIQDFIPDTWQVMTWMKQILVLSYNMWPQAFLKIITLYCIFDMIFQIWSHFIQNVFKYCVGYYFKRKWNFSSSAEIHTCNLEDLCF